MRGRTPKQTSLITLASPEDVVPKDHPLRAIKTMADAALRELSGVFNEMYADAGRPSIPPERLLKAMLRMALCSVRSERMFAEQLGYNLLFKWFLDMDMTEPAFNPASFRKEPRPLARARSRRSILPRGRRAGTSEAADERRAPFRRWHASRRVGVDEELSAEGRDDDNDCNGWGHFRGEKRCSETHESKTDPEAKLARKGNGREGKLSFCLNALM